MFHHPTYYLKNKNYFLTILSFNFLTFFPLSFLGRAKMFLNVRFGTLDVAQPALQVNEPNKTN